MKETITIEKKVYESVLRNTLRVNELEEENAKLKEIIKEMLSELVDENDVTSLGLAEYFSQELLLKLHEVLK